MKERQTMISRIIPLALAAMIAGTAQAQQGAHVTHRRSRRCRSGSTTARCSASRQARSSTPTPVRRRSTPPPFQASSATGAYTHLSDVPAFAFSLPPAAVAVGFPASLVLAPTIVDNYNLQGRDTAPALHGIQDRRLQGDRGTERRRLEPGLQQGQVRSVFNIKTAYWALFRARELKKLADDNVAQITAHLNGREEPGGPGARDDERHARRRGAALQRAARAGGREQQRAARARGARQHARHPAFHGHHDRLAGRRVAPAVRRRSTRSSAQGARRPPGNQGDGRAGEGGRGRGDDGESRDGGRRST